MPASSKISGPTSSAYAQALPCGNFSGREALGAFADMQGDTLMTQPSESSMPLRPRVVPGTPMQAMTVQDPGAVGGKHPFVVILSKQQATDIYMMRSPDTTADAALKAVAGKSSMVAEMYRVSPKTIRDIWNRKTWTQVTRASWSTEEAEEYAQEQALAKLPPSERAALKDEFKKRRGRPPGSKDTRPRRRRLKAGEEGSEHSEGVMYVTTDAGAVEVRPIPAAPRTSDSVEHPVRNASPVRKAPPFDGQRANGMKALRAFELGKTTPVAQRFSSVRAHSFDNLPSSPSVAAPAMKAVTFSGSRSASFDDAPACLSPSEVAPAPYRTPSAPRPTPGAGLCEEAESAVPLTYNSAEGCSMWPEEEPACNAEPGCADDSGYCPMPGSGAEVLHREDSGFKPQPLLGPVDDQLDLLSSPRVSAFVPAVQYWEEKQALDEEHRRHMERLSQLEQEFEHRKQRHQAQFDESRTAFHWAAQQHSRLMANSSTSASTVTTAPTPAAVSAQTVAAPVKMSPIVAPMAAGPSMEKMSPAVPCQQQPAPPRGSNAAESSEMSMLTLERGWSVSHASASGAEAPCDFGWFPGSSEAGGPPGLSRNVSTISNMSDGGNSWHAPFFGQEHCVKHLLGGSATNSPMISHLAARGNVSQLGHQGGPHEWWSDTATGLGSA